MYDRFTVKRAERYDTESIASYTVLVHDTKDHVYVYRNHNTGVSVCSCTLHTSGEPNSGPCEHKDAVASAVAAGTA